VSLEELVAGNKEKPTR
ncbi:MAG: hypothetical protein ABEI97_03575, partial [Candidatus Nanohaloarchaea archaeon]